MFVLGIIAVIEAVSLFAVNPAEDNAAAGILVIALLPKDEELYIRLENLSRSLSSGKLCADEIVFVDYGTEQRNTELCRRFCYEHPMAVYTDPAGLEKIISEIFAIKSKK